MQTFTVPPSVSFISVEIAGSAGGTYGESFPGYGARVQAILSVIPGTVLKLFIGGQGGHSNYNTLAAGGWNGGGNSYGRTTSGGGASDIRIGGTTLANRVIVAGGGGGYYWSGCNQKGGDGGLYGTDGSGNCGIYHGGGGVLIEGGSGNGYYHAGFGALGLGGNGYNSGTEENSGGGGGYYGGR
jgi:hypothetical protein